MFDTDIYWPVIVNTTMHTDVGTCKWKSKIDTNPAFITI